MNGRWVGVLLLGIATCAYGQQDEPVRYKAAVVALTDDAELRMEFERTLVAKARAHNYDAVGSYELVPDVAELNDRRFADTLAANGVRAVLMVRPAAIGPGSSLDAVRDEVSPRMLADMRAFAGEVSSSGGDDLIAVVHLAIYTLAPNSKPELISSGAVWLDEPVDDRTQGISRLQDLILGNVDGVRPAIRQHLGLPPLN
jgi:hypothetical protein